MVKQYPHKVKSVGSTPAEDAHGKGCNGCRAVKMDIMLSMNLKSDPSDVMDVFLTTKQAEDLIAGLQKQLEFNKTEE